MMSNLFGTEKQVLWAEEIKRDAIASIRRAASVPGFEKACKDLEEAIESISDAKWLVECRHKLNLGVSWLPGSGVETVCQKKINDHQLLCVNRIGRPMNRLGTANISKERAVYLSEAFRSAQREQLKLVNSGRKVLTKRSA